jgi:hypothetical protein
MSTFKIEGAKLLDSLIPESNWEALDTDRYTKVFEKLTAADEIGAEFNGYIKKRKPRIGFHKQYKSGGGWTFLGNITLSPGDDPFDPYVLSLILHETFHLSQPLLTRLSVQGELRAWHFQQRTYPQIAATRGKPIGAAGEAYSAARVTSELWETLAQLSPDSRDDLEMAQKVMREIAPGYRSDVLPLFPLTEEIKFYLRQWKFKEAFGLIRRLLHAASEGD